MNQKISCGAYLGSGKSYDFLEYTTNITLSTFNVSKGYNYITKEQIGKVYILEKTVPIIISNDDLSIPIDFSPSTTYQDYTFTELDTVNKKLVSVKAVNSKFMRYYVNIRYSYHSKNFPISNTYKTRNIFKAIAFQNAPFWYSNNDMIKIIKVNGTLEIYNFTCNSTGKLNQEIQIYVSYYGNKSIPLILDYDDGLIEYRAINDGQSYLNITKNYSTFGQFNIKANLFNNFASCQVYINDYNMSSFLNKIR
jgi:hypothetical protein